MKLNKSKDIGQGETLPEAVWLLFDKDNGDSDAKRYTWWFKTRREALAHKRHRNEMRKRAIAKHGYDPYARLAGPFKFKSDK